MGFGHFPLPSFRGWNITGNHVTIILVLIHYQNGTYLKNILEATCPIARSVAFAGDAWSLLILRDAHFGLTRFDDFRKSLDIAPTMLTRRLGMLTEEGLLEKRLYSERPPREEYVLTEAGRDFLPVLFMIGAWGRQHRGGGKLMRFVDAETGEDIQPIAVDATTGARNGTRPIRVVAA
jgi:DNA-binding HxlR family transcriptional regulator